MTILSHLLVNTYLVALVSAAVIVISPTTSSLARRALSDYQEVFPGIGPDDPSSRDASIEGPAYLTFKLVNNATYNVAECVDFCSGIPKCVFVNLFYEYNNPGLDAGTSNLKCAAYADVHTAVRKTNFGGQQLAPTPAGKTYIRRSSGWGVKSLLNPFAPENYELTYGPIDFANNAPGYMGFKFIDSYNVSACAQECNKRSTDYQGGSCQYFNIWRAVVHGVPTTFTCSMYYTPTDASTAHNGGGSDLKVTYGRGYKRQNLLTDGGFESFSTRCTGFCYNATTPTWQGTSPTDGRNDASVFRYQEFAHTGKSLAVLGSATGFDNLSGTLTVVHPLATSAGRTYEVSFFHQSTFSGPVHEAGSFVEVVWNGRVVKTIRPGYEDWKLYQVNVVAIGGDTLAFRGGAAPAWSFIDDVTLFLL